jgi:hypothetical protein
MRTYPLIVLPLVCPSTRNNLRYYIRATALSILPWTIDVLVARECHIEEGEQEHGRGWTLTLAMEA